MPRAVARKRALAHKRAIAHKLCTGRMALARANFSLAGVMGACAPNLVWLLHLVESVRTAVAVVMAWDRRVNHS
jgi:hypothetical protein